jgi:hypothetical protein
MTNGRNNSNRKRNPPTPSLEQKGNKTIKDKVLRVPQKSNKSVTQNRNQNRGKTGRAAANQYVPQSLEAQGYVSDLERRARITEHYADKNDWPPVGPNERNLTFDSKSSYNTGTGLKEVYTIIPLLTDRRAVVVGIKDDGSVHYLSTLATNKHIADCASTHTPIAAMVKLWCQGSPDNSSQLGNVESHIIAGHVDADSLLDGFDDNEIFQKQYNKRFNLGADTHTADLAMCLPVLALMDLTHSIPCTTRSAQQNPGITLIRQFDKFRRDTLGLPTDEISDHLLRSTAGWVKMHEIQIPVNYSGKIKVNVSGSFRSQNTVSTTDSDPSPPSVALYVTDTTGAEYGIGSQGIGSISSGTPKSGDVVAYGGSTFFNFEIDQLSDVLALWLIMEREFSLLSSSKLQTPPSLQLNSSLSIPKSPYVTIYPVWMIVFCFSSTLASVMMSPLSLKQTTFRPSYTLLIMCTAKRPLMTIGWRSLNRKWSKTCSCATHV